MGACEASDLVSAVDRSRDEKKASVEIGTSATHARQHLASEKPKHSCFKHGITIADSNGESKGGLAWAGPVACVLDLHEARLDMQASQFLKAMEQNRPGDR